MKVGIIGAPSAGTMFSLANEREQEIKKVERKKRGDLIQSIAPDYKDQSILLGFQTLTIKKLRTHSKEFIFLYYALEEFNIARMVTHGQGISSYSIKRLIATLGFLIGTKQFTSMDLEDQNTDYFQFVFALYVALKELHGRLTNLDPKTLQKYVYVSSEIGLRISSMYVDKRTDM